MTECCSLWTDEEIIVIDKVRKKTVAIDPATGLPYFFVFVNNTSSSNGTYESPYHSFSPEHRTTPPRTTSSTYSLAMGQRQEWIEYL